MNDDPGWIPTVGDCPAHLPIDPWIATSHDQRMRDGPIDSAIDDGT